MADDSRAFTIIGKAQRKVDATAKVTGRTVFADDLFLPRMLYAKLLRSPHPHAEIVRIDTSRTETLRGVKATLTGKDLPIPFGILPVSQDEHALACWLRHSWKKVPSQHARRLSMRWPAISVVALDT